MFDCEEIWLRGTIKIKPRSFVFEVHVLSLFFLSFLILILVVSLFSRFICDIICLLSLGFLAFYFKACSTVRFIILSSALFSAFLCLWVRVLRHVCICIQMGCVRRPYVCVHILKPKNPNSTFSVSVSLILLFNMPLF